jgi:uncharacterized protein (DUF952 family)
LRETNILQMIAFKEVRERLKSNPELFTNRELIILFCECAKLEDEMMWEPSDDEGDGVMRINV